MKAAQLPDGRWTIGYGHTLTARGGTTVSEKDAEALLLYDLISVAHVVNEMTFAPLNQNQFDALVCFAFNIGVDNFKRSGVLRRINEGSLLQAACAMELWRKADFEGERIVIDALVRRRSAEKTLFLTPPDGVWVAAPSPILRPKVDYDAGFVVPSQTPTAVTTSFTGDRATIEREEGLPLPPVAPEADGFSAAEQAAAAVSARLEAILPEEPAQVANARTLSGIDLALPDAPTPAALVTLASPSPALFDAPDARPQPTPLQPRPEPVAPTLEPTLFETATRGSASVFNLDGFSTSDGAAAAPLSPPAVKPEARPINLGLLLTLGALGLAMFGGGVLWILTVASGPNFSQIKLFGYGASMIGAICFVVSAYLLLRRLAGPGAANDA